MRNILTLCCLILGSTFSLFAQEPEPLVVPFGDLRARSIGPAVMSGRITDIDAVNNEPTILYVASATGGLWKSINAGSTFRPIFDEHTMSIGNVAIDQNHPDTIWVGTGEPWVRNTVSVGTGMYVSTNGGSSWTFKGLENSERIANIAIDPANSAVIYVAVQGHLWNANEERGVYKTSDFGQTWEKVLYVDENTGCADISMDPNNPNVLYAAMWEHRRSPHFFNSGGPGSGLYKSTDGGANWTKLSKDIPEGNLGRIAVAVAPSNSNIVYATIECEKQEEKGLYRSEDAGATWEHVSTDFNTTVRPFYFSRLVVDPSNEDRIFKCGLNLTISDDGGSSFRTVGSGVHSDIHAVWVNPNNPKHVVTGTDGGGYRSLDGGYTFEMFMDLPLSQFYHISADNEEPFNVYGGLQDNGTWYGPSSSPGGVENKDWELSNWGDGFYSFAHPNDVHIVYAESQGGNIVRFNKKDGQAKDIKPIPVADDPEYRFNWNAPIHISPNNPERLYFGGQFLFMSMDRGDSWTKLSPDLTTNDPERQKQSESGGLSIDNSTAENNTTIYTISESPVDEKVIWVGTDDGYLQVTKDGGKSWTNVTANIPGLPKFTWCTKVEASHFDANTCYVTFDGHKQGDKTPYLFKTTDMGATWTSLITEDVEGYALTINEDLEAENLLFLGTEFGLYISLDGGISWKRFSNNLPKVGVRSMQIHARDHALVIGTHGRGVYIIDNIDLLRQLNPEVAAEKLAFLDGGPTYFRLPQQGRPFGGAGNFSGQNPEDVASIVYFMKRRHTFGKMKLQVFDEDGNFIKELPAGKSAGINVVNLPTRLPMPKAAPTNNRMALFGSVFPPTLAEGTYEVKVLKGKKDVFTTNFELRMEPSAAKTYPEADRKLAHKTLMRLYHMTNDLGYMYYAMEDMHEQANAVDGLSKKQLAKVKDFALEVEKYKASLVSLRGDFYVDEGTSLREEVSTLFLGISQYPGKPSASQLEKADILEKKMGEVKAKFEGFKAQMTTINERLAKKELDLIKIKTLEEYLED